MVSNNSLATKLDSNKLLISVVISIALYFVYNLYFQQQQSIALAIISLLVILWTNQALPMGVVSLFALVLFPVFKVADFSNIARLYASPSIFLFLGGFMISVAIEKVDLHKYFAKKIISIFGSKPLGLIFSIMLVAGLLSSILSNSTTTLILLPMIISLATNVSIGKRFALATAYAASIGGTMTPIGTPPNLIMIGFLNQQGIDSIGFIKWILYVGPISIVFLAIVAFILSIGLPKDRIEVNIKQNKLNINQKKVLIMLCTLLLLLFLFASLEYIFGIKAIDDNMLLLLFGLINFIPRVGTLVWRDSKKIPYEILFLFGAGFAISNIIQTTGLSLEISHFLNFLSFLDGYWQLLVIILFLTIVTEIVSNTALAALMVPIIYTFLKTNNFPHPEVALLAATVATSYAFVMPIATPPNAIVMASGILKVKDMFKMGILIDIIGVILLTTVAYFIW